MKKINILFFALVFLLSACKTEPSEQISQQAPADTTKKADPTSNNNKKAPAAPVQMKTESDQLLFLSKLFLKYSNNGKANTATINNELSKIDNKNLDFVKNFVFNATHQSERLLSEEFLKKPSKEELQRIYKLRHINWNSMSMTGVSSAVIDTFDINAVNNLELVTAYYRLLMGGLQLPRNPTANFTNTNIDLNKLGLENAKEKGLVFYVISDGFSSNYNRNLRSINNDCKQAKEMAAKFPKINGKPLLKAKAPKFKDFNFMLGNGAKDKSFQDFFTKRFAQASAHFKDCK